VLQLAGKMVMDTPGRTLFCVHSDSESQKAMAAGSTGERPFFEIVTSVRYWVIHAVTLPSIFLAGFLFVSTGLAYDAFGTPRPNEYYRSAEVRPPVVSDRYDSKLQIDERLSTLTP